MAENEIAEIPEPPLPTEDEMFQHFMAAEAAREALLKPECVSEFRSDANLEETLRSENSFRRQAEASSRTANQSVLRGGVEDGVLRVARKSIINSVLGTPVTPEDYSYQTKCRLAEYVNRVFPFPAQAKVAPCPMPSLGEYPGVEWEYQRRECEKALKEGKDTFFYGLRDCAHASLAIQREAWLSMAKEFNLNIEATILASIERWKKYWREVVRINKLRSDTFAKLEAKFEDIKQRALLKVEQEALRKAKESVDEAQRKVDEFLKKKVR